MSKNTTHARKVRIGKAPSCFATPLMEYCAFFDVFLKNTKNWNFKIFPTSAAFHRCLRWVQTPIGLCGPQRAPLGATWAPRGPRLRAMWAGACPQEPPGRRVLMASGPTWPKLGSAGRYSGWAPPERHVGHGGLPRAPWRRLFPGGSERGCRRLCCCSGL